MHYAISTSHRAKNWSIYSIEGYYLIFVVGTEMVQPTVALLSDHECVESHPTLLLSVLEVAMVFLHHF